MRPNIGRLIRLPPTLDVSNTNTHVYLVHDQSKPVKHTSRTLLRISCSALVRLAT